LSSQAAKQKTGWQRIARRIRVPLGFGFAIVYLWLAQPSVPMVVIGAVVVAFGIGIRAAASAQLRKNEELATSGPYSYTRNPLYLGSLVIGVGFALAARNAWIWILILAFLLVIYMPVIRNEETFLRSAFPAFDDYARRVPRLWPRWSGESLTASFSRELYLKHREYNALIGAALMFAALLVKMTIAHRGALNAGVR
jgi:protein-S-isoprenylcysteine O-methyltransferase Ste14